MNPTIDQFVREATRALGGSSPSPRLDVEVLLQHVTGLTRSALITRAHDALPAEHLQPLHALLARRIRGEPIAYLTGRREFWSLDLIVTPDVLIPRPETELLVEQALARIPADADWTIADLGTGSGAIALAIARERPRCRVIATDLSAAALAVARRNARQHELQNIEFRHGPWFEPLSGQQFELLASNPPYVAQADVHLTRGDLRFEPRTALVAGHDGLEAFRQIVRTAADRPGPGHWLVLEHGADQAATVAGLLEQHGYTDIANYPDLAGLDRVTAARLVR